MELLIIRHGQSQGESEGRHEGAADFPLNRTGQEQAHKIAAYLYRHYPLNQIYTSPQQRAQESAEIIAQPLGIPIVLAESLRDRNNGQLAGMLRSEAMSRFPYPETGRSYEQDLHGGESELDLRWRVEVFFAALCREEPEQRIGIVTHTSVINMLFRCFLNLPNNTPIHLSTSLGAIHFWNLSPKYRQVIFCNFTGHLHDDSLL